MFSMVAFVFAIFFGLVCGALSSVIAESKGCDSGTWFWAGLLLGPFGLIAICGMPDRHLRRYLREIALAVGAKEESLEDVREINISTHKEPSSRVRVRDGEIFQITRSSPESIWEDLLRLLPPNIRDVTDPLSSEYLRSKINIMDANKKMLARFDIARSVRQGTYWKLGQIYPRI